MKTIIILSVLFVFTFSGQVAFCENSCNVLYNLYKSECVGSPKSSEFEFARANWGILDHYSEVSNQDNFWVYCKRATDRPAPYASFKKDVCSKKLKQTVSTLSAMTISDNEIKTRHGNLTLNDIDGQPVLMFKNKKCMEFPGPAASFDKKVYKVGNTNVFIISFSIGASMQSINLIIDKPDGVYIVEDFDVKGQSINLKAGKLIIKETIKYKKYQITEFDGNSVIKYFDHETDKSAKKNVPLKKLNCLE